MKQYFPKISLYTAILILVLSTSCNKTHDSPTLTGTDKNVQELVKMLQTIETKITSSLKSSESLTVDSAVWYAEALLNYRKARADQWYESFEVQQYTYTLHLSDGLAGLGHLAALYNNMTTDINQSLMQMEGTENYLKLADLRLDSVQGNTAHLSMTGIFGLNLIAGLYLPFNAGDDWIWGTLGQYHGQPPAGKCNDTMVGISDASDQLQRKLNYPAVQYAEPYVFINLTLRYADGIMNYNERLYTGWNYPEQNCLTADTLNHYLLQSHMIINNYNEGLRPQGKEFSHVDITDDLIPWVGMQRHFHYYKVTYGVKIPAPYLD